MTRAHRILLSILILFAVACIGVPPGSPAQSGKTKKSTSSAKPPKWFQAIPKDSLNLVARGQAQSKDQQVAVDKAVAAARDSIVIAIETPWKELVRRIREEGITAEEPERGAVTLHGSKIKEQKVSKKKKTWTAFVLVSLPKASIPPLLLERARSDSRWYALVKETKAVQDLETGVRTAQEHTP